MKLKLLLSTALALSCLVPVSVKAEEKPAEEELTEMEKQIGHENAEETAYMNSMNPVSDEEDTGIAITDSYVELSVDSSRQLNVEVLAEGIDRSQIEWSVDDDSIITIDENGMINAHSPGRATVRAVSEDGEYYDICTVEIIPVYSESVLISYDELEMVYGETHQLSASVEPANATLTGVRWSSNDEDVVTVDQSGKIKAVGPGTTAVTAAAEDDNSAANCLVTVLFTDASDESRYFYEPVYWALRHYVTNGYGGAGKFSPDVKCTREQIVSFIWRLAGEPDPEKYTKFADVKETDWYYKAVSWAYEKNITYGLNDGTNRFGVGMPCTREMCITFLHRAAGSPMPSEHASFADVDSSRYYYEPISWAYETDITTGLNDGTNRFGIGTSCTRAMVVSFLYRQYTGLSVTMDTFETVTANGRSYLVYKKDGKILKKNFKLDQVYYQVDPKTGEIIHTQNLFTDEIYMEGVDISEHNGELDLSQFEGGFAIIRVAWGTHEDILAKRNMDLCEQLKIPYGVYLYDYALDDEQAESEADYILELIKGRDIKLGVWFDIENDSYKASRIPGWPNAAVISRHCAIFCDKVAAAGYHTGIYTSYYWFLDYVKGLNRYDKWTAHWGYNDGSWAVNLNGKCNIHQFTSNPIDRNVFYTDPNLMSNDD